MNQPASTFTESELDRYARHIVLRELGGPGQKKLKKAKVLVIGAGGLGAPALQYLAAAGVGTIGVIDDDVVDNVCKAATCSSAERMLIVLGTWALGRNWSTSTFFTVPETSPGDILFFNGFTDLIEICITVNADQCKWLVCQLFYERPLVWVHSPARWSPIAPEVDDDNFSAIVT